MKILSDFWSSSLKDLCYYGSIVFSGLLNIFLIILLFRRNKEKVTDERLKIWIDLSKWFIASVGLVIMTTIIDSGFKDREVGIKEIGVYDKYVELVTNSSRIADRRLLAQFFSSVTPSKTLREGWVTYYTVVDSEYKEFLKKKEEIKEVLNDTLSIPEPQIIEYQKELNQIEKQLTPTLGDKEKQAMPAKWSMRFLNDEDATKIKFAKITPVTIKELQELEINFDANAHRQLAETKVYEIQCKIESVRLDEMGAYLLLISDEFSNKLLAVIPDPENTESVSSGHAQEYEKCRNKIKNLVDGNITTKKRFINIKARIVGVGFVDSHSTSKNGFEINPVLDIK